MKHIDFVGEKLKKGQVVSKTKEFTEKWQKILDQEKPAGYKLTDLNRLMAKVLNQFEEMENASTEFFAYVWDLLPKEVRKAVSEKSIERMNDGGGK